MVYNIQNHWVTGLCPVSGILNTENTTFWKLDVSVSDEGKDTPTLFGPLERDNLNQWRRKQIPFQKRCFLVFRIPDDAQSPETQCFWVLHSVIHKLVKSTGSLRASTSIPAYTHTIFSTRVAVLAARWLLGLLFHPKMEAGRSSETSVHYINTRRLFLINLLYYVPQILS
jgi:hypothetical protein